MSRPNRTIDANESGRTRSDGRRLLWWLSLMLWLCVGTWAGCTPERRYRVLSFFFDGVPDPNAPAQLSGAVDDEGNPIGPGGTAVPRLSVVLHKPYADNQCQSCHEGASGSFESFQPLEPSICLKCHQDTPTQYPVMHGPVAAVECLWCHTPHESSIAGLLKQAAPAVCTQCHDRELLSAQPPEHFMPDKSCLSCHVAHGGQKHGLLREGVNLVGDASAAPAPTATPTTVPQARGDRP